MSADPAGIKAGPSCVENAREEVAMCSYIVEKALVTGSAKGANGWMRIDTANVYYDHPYHAPFDHGLNIDFVCEADGACDRVAVELSADSALELVRKILAALATGQAAHSGTMEPIPAMRS
jgi:hypothetical protein